MSDRGTIDAMFILRRMQEEYNCTGKKLCVFDKGYVPNGSI